MLQVSRRSSTGQDPERSGAVRCEGPIKGIMTPTETARAVPGSEHGLRHPRPLRPSPRGLTRWRGAPPPFPRPGPPAPQRGGRHALGPTATCPTPTTPSVHRAPLEEQPGRGRPDSPARASSTAARPRSDCLPAAPAPAHPRIRAPASASHQIKNGAPPAPRPDLEGRWTSHVGRVHAGVFEADE